MANVFLISREDLPSSLKAKASLLPHSMLTLLVHMLSRVSSHFKSCLSKVQSSLPVFPTYSEKWPLAYLDYVSALQQEAGFTVLAQVHQKHLPLGNRVQAS